MANSHLKPSVPIVSYIVASNPLSYYCLMQSYIWFTVIIQESAEGEPPPVIAARSRSSTEVVDITVVQDENTIDHGVL